MHGRRFLFSISSLVFCLLTSSLTQAQNPPSLPEDQLGFPVERSQIKILPQRFEYSLIDANTFQVGNLSIRATDIGIRTTAQKNQKFIFYWPLDLLDSGEIVIKDSSGKALWRKVIDQSQIQLKKSKSSTRLATLEHDANDPELIQKIQRSPFFQLCAHRENPQTKIYFCSKNLYLIKKNKQIGVSSRDSFRPESFVEINGKTVGAQGYVYLNSSRDPLSLRALMLSGSTIEIDTRMKDVQFQDVVLSDDEKTLIVSALNKESENAKESIEDRQWTTSLDVDRPSLYIKGEGNIPLRQEFIIEGAVRKSNVKVQILGDAPKEVSSSEMSLRLSADETLLLAADKNTSLEKLGGGEYSWTLKNLRRNEGNLRYLKVTDSKQNPTQNFWAAYDVKRISAFEAMLHLYAPLRADAQLSWIANPRYQANLRYDTQLTKNSKYDNSSIISLEALYKFPAAAHMVHPHYHLGAHIDSFSSSGGNFTSYGLIVGAQYKEVKIFGFNVPWTLIDAKIPLASSDYTVMGSFDVQMALRFPESLDRFHEAGLKYRSLVFEKDSVKSKLSEAYVFYGFGILF